MPEQSEQLPIPNFPVGHQADDELSTAAEAALRLTPDLALPESERRKLDADLARYDKEFDRVDKNSPSIAITKDRLAEEGIFHPLEKALQHADEIEAKEVAQISERAQHASPRPKSRQVKRSPAQNPGIRRLPGYDKRPDK